MFFFDFLCLSSRLFKYRTTDLKICPNNWYVIYFNILCNGLCSATAATTNRLGIHFIVEKNTIFFSKNPCQANLLHLMLFLSLTIWQQKKTVRQAYLPMTKQ